MADDMPETLVLKKSRWVEKENTFWDLPPLRVMWHNAYINVKIVK